MSLDQNLAAVSLCVSVGLYQLGNELRPEHSLSIGDSGPGLYQLGNELRPELNKACLCRRLDCIS